MNEQERKPILERCELKVVDGHFEAVCQTEEDRAELAKVFNEEAILRIQPKAKLE